MFLLHKKYGGNNMLNKLAKIENLIEDVLDDDDPNFFGDRRLARKIKKILAGE